MATPLAVLLIEDSDADAELILHCLRRAEFEVVAVRAENAAEMRAALGQRSWDIVLSDYTLRAFAYSAALDVLRAAQADIPFIVVSANLGEEVVVKLMKTGVHDYVMKGNLARLPFAVRRELNDAQQRRAHARAAAALRESEERWNFALEGAGYGVWDWNIRTGQVVYSTCWKAMHGFADHEIDDTVAAGLDLVHPEDRGPVMQAMREYLAGNMTRYQNEHRARGRDGSWKWVLDHGKIVSRDANGAPLRMICTHVDISERKRAEAALHELNEQLETRVEEGTRELRQAMAQIIESEKLASLGVLVAGVSHELNTPIGNMVLAASALVDRLREVDQMLVSGAVTRSLLKAGIAECMDASGIIVRNGNRASDLIESFKRVSVDQASQRRRRFDLRTTVQDSLNALSATTRRAKVKVDVRIPAGIEMDSFPGHLEQIINNIVMNSIMHGFDGKGGGQVVIDAGIEDGMVSIDYSDDGHGITPEVQRRVFEPFFTTKLGQGGSGLGLSIVHNLVQAIFKGRLRLESDAGQGVRLFFCFPAVTPA
ncbi:MAG: ATP-binding protein [Pseudomonadota bacterium]